MHPFRNEILHVDFQRVDENRKIHMKVPLHFVNGENSPAVKVSSAIVSHVLNELDVSCLPKDLPEFIEVDLSNARRRPLDPRLGADAAAGCVASSCAASSIRSSPRPSCRRRSSRKSSKRKRYRVPRQVLPPGAAPGAPGAEAKPAEGAAGEKKDAGKDKDKDDKKKK